jgi:hypothetical protein
MRTANIVANDIWLVIPLVQGIVEVYHDGTRNQSEFYEWNS